MKPDDLFRRIDPPRDGLARLRSRLDADEGRIARRPRRIGLAVGALCAMGVAGLAVSPVGPYRLTLLSEPAPVHSVARDLRSLEHPGLVGLGIQPPADSPVSVANHLAREVPVHDDDVIYFVVAARDADRPTLPAWDSGGSGSTWNRHPHQEDAP